ncbi:hypothetical protein [Lacrimispora sp. 210928-DFI.3.58]|uniref:hypothetical protein n=1 Tax=Lacrimispora sp. 210928-DFI.3.58 TaxID=2883214 RepID=UPI001D095781|nr:hypothetical protein [Lacrimispora sp. 210928-DFI.3.58]MCB7317801.1 hypothetical protein [Lacrimispora sp. 210928-DFI.3.58]
MKKFKLLVAAGMASVFMGITAYAGGWQQDTSGWWYQNDNGSYPKDCWQWIDGNNDGIAECYYFDNQGYCLMNGITPDGYTVDGNGAWHVFGTVQTQKITSQIPLTKEIAAEIVKSHTDKVGYWSPADEIADNILIMWQIWPTGFRGKFTVDLNTGDCYEEGPYWGPEDPLEELFTREYHMNVRSYLQ